MKGKGVYSVCPKCSDYTGCYMAGYCGRCGYTAPSKSCKCVEHKRMRGEKVYAVRS